MTMWGMVRFPLAAAGLGASLPHPKLTLLETDRVVTTFSGTVEQVLGRVKSLPLCLSFLNAAKLINLSMSINLSMRAVSKPQHSLLVVVFVILLLTLALLTLRVCFTVVAVT